jgi:tRNA C32,U32 (ribose-2'-O)-methylase TrmJ
VERVEGLFGHLRGVLEEVGFARDSSFDGVMRDLRQLAARARASEREVTILRGILRRIRNALRRGGAI